MLESTVVVVMVVVVVVTVEVEFCLYNNARSMAAIPNAIGRQHNTLRVIYRQLSGAQEINSILLSTRYIPGFFTLFLSFFFISMTMNIITQKRHGTQRFPLL